MDTEVGADRKGAGREEGEPSDAADEGPRGEAAVSCSTRCIDRFDIVYCQLFGAWLSCGIERNYCKDGDALRSPAAR